ncbi:unnamed protein product [Brachionus calyciflorus]|uniref:Uncharacterized protein n=1 Tax=Brachionus calyciflorus TaxID=104777 RepID=A0A813S6W6_9BILA|nr:unnamed protein product [Brachionus calyciflorus]
MSHAPNKSTSVVPVKGHLVNKSSPLATESCKLGNQFITAQNLASHYKRINSAKSSIDTSAPKSLIKSVKAQDRVKREILRNSWANRNTERAKSAETQSISEEKSESKSFTTVSRTLKSENTRVLPDQKKINQSVSNMAINFTKHNPSRVMLYKPKDPEPEEKHQFVNFENREKNARNMMTTLLFNVHATNDPNLSGIQNPALKAMSRLVSGHNYDVLDIHAHKFKQPSHEFQPRIKDVEKSSSKLRESTCYEPPRRQKKINFVEKDLESTRISNDHEIKNLKNQKLNSSKIESDDDENDFDFVRTVREPSRDQLNNSNILNSFTSRRLTASQTSLKRAVEKEEELKYLAFVKDVTDDILQRGLISNRVINNCFNYHLNKNKKQLDEKKMRDLLDTLRQDIGIPDEDDTEITTKYYQTVNKAILLDKEKNKENIDDANTEYLTLRQFGFTNLGTSRSIHNDIQENNKQTDLNLSHTTRMFNDFENQIIKNIQTIRRNSTDSSGTEKALSRKNSTESPELQNSIPQSPKQVSILKKSNSQSSVQSRQNSFNSKENMDKEELKEKTLQKQISQSDDDDDDDLFISSKHDSLPASLNASHKSSLTRPNFTKEDYDDEDALFNNNYSDTEDKNQNSENDDNFDEILKTKAFKRGPIRKRSTASNDSDANERSRSLETPTPRPRMVKNISNEKNSSKNGNTSEEDDF